MSAPEEPPVTGSHYQPRLGVVLTLLVIFVVATFLVLRPSSSAPTTNSVAPTSTTTAPGTHATTTTTVRPARSRVRVQVANGTLVTGLAHTYTQKLLVLGWDTLTEINAPHHATRTLVYFGAGYQWAAQRIASEIKVPTSAVVPLGHSSPVPGASGDNVIVILGPDVAGG